MNKDGTANVWDALKAIGIALIGALLIVLVGTSLKHSWLLFLVCPAVTGTGAYLATRFSPWKTEKTTIIWFTAIGLAFAAGTYFFA